MAEDEDSWFTRKKAGHRAHSPIPPRLNKKLGRESSRKTVTWLGSVVVIYFLWMGLFLSVLGSGTGPDFGSPDVVIHGIIFEDGNWDPDVISETVDSESLVAGVTYIFRIYSDDTVHGFGITELGIDTGIILPGGFVDLQITFPSPGTYIFECTVFCSTEHSAMSGTIIVS